MENRKVKIYFTSDIHGFFYSTSYATGKDMAQGLLKCSNQFKKDGNTLVIDGGDILQGSPLTAYCHKYMQDASAIAGLMNACGYDFVALGNHDFNYGFSYLKTYLSNLSAVCVCQNLETPEGSTAFPYQIRTMENGLRVAVIGITTEYINVWEKPEHLEGYKITDPFRAAKQALTEAKQKADITVGVYHGGFERDLQTGKILSESSENIAYRICEELDFDLLLTGHQHMSVDGQYVKGTYVVQPAENGKEFHEIVICADGDCQPGTQGRIQITSARRTPQGDDIPAQRQWIDPLEEQVQRWLEDTVGTLTRELKPASHLEMAAKGNGIANLFNQIQLYYSGAMISATSLANEVAGLPEHVTRRDVLMTYPYQNTLKVLKIDGKNLKAALERSAEYFELDEDGKLIIAESFLKPKVEHYNYDYFAGVEYTIDVSRQHGQRVIGLRYHGKAVEEEDVFTICISDYRASGTGGYDMYRDCQVVKEYAENLADLILDYFEKKKTVTVIDASPCTVVNKSL